MVRGPPRSPARDGPRFMRRCLSPRPRKDMRRAVPKPGPRIAAQFTAPGLIPIARRAKCLHLCRSVSHHARQVRRSSPKTCLVSCFPFVSTVFAIAFCARRYDSKIVTYDLSSVCNALKKTPRCLERARRQDLKGIHLSPRATAAPRRQSPGNVAKIFEKRGSIWAKGVRPASSSSPK